MEKVASIWEVGTEEEGGRVVSWIVSGERAWISMVEVVGSFCGGCSGGCFIDSKVEKVN